MGGGPLAEHLMCLLAAIDIDVDICCPLEYHLCSQDVIVSGYDRGISFSSCHQMPFLAVDAPTRIQAPQGCCLMNAGSRVLYWYAFAATPQNVAQRTDYRVLYSTSVVNVITYVTQNIKQMCLWNTKRMRLIRLKKSYLPTIHPLLSSHLFFILSVCKRRRCLEI